MSWPGFFVVPTGELPDDLESAKDCNYLIISYFGKSIAVSFDEVLEIAEGSGITPVPTAAEHLIGLTNIRGELIPVIDPGALIDNSYAVGKLPKISRYVLIRRDGLTLAVPSESTHTWAEKAAPPADVMSDSPLFRYQRFFLTVDGKSVPVINIPSIFEDTAS